MDGWKYPACWIEHLSFWSLFISRWASAYSLVSFFIYPLRGQLAEMSWRVVFLCLHTVTTHSLPLFFSLLFQQVHHGRLHEKLRLIRTTGTDETTLGVPALPQFPSFYTGHILFSHRIPHYEAAYNLFNLAIWRLCIDGSWA